MSDHQYTPQQALAVLTQKLRAKDEVLAAHVLAAIDAGKDVAKSNPANGKRRNARIYRQTVPFTHEEALEVALDALQAYFVELPLFVDAAAESFAKTTIGVPIDRGSSRAEARELLYFEQDGDEKLIVVELQTATQITKTGDELLPLKRTPRERIEEQQRHIAQLRTMTDFT
ncbi:MAG: hypothetical protein ACRD3W_13330 [Terriglobales bacterium]